MSTARVSPYCTCADHGVTGLDQLVELVNAGHDQWAASRALWSPISPEVNALVVEVAGARAAEFVRTELYARLPWLRPMPEPVEGVAA